MNYLFKKSSSGGLVECVLNGAKCTNENHCYYRNRLGKQAVSRSNVQCRTLNYYSALKLLEKNGISKNERVKEKTRKTANDSKKFTEMLKIMPLKHSDEKVMNFKRSKSSGHIFDCTKSYDPNLLNCNLEEFSFYAKNNNIRKDRPNLNKFESVTHSGTMCNKFDKLKSPCGSSLKNNENPKWDVLGYKSHVENMAGTEPLKSQTVFNVNPVQSLEKSKGVIATQEPQEDSSKSSCEGDFNHQYSSLKVLHSCIDICATTCMIKEAHQLVQSFRGRSEWIKAVNQKSKILQQIYNSLLFTLSSKGFWCFTKAVMQLMEIDNVKLNSASFAAILNCLAANKESNNYEYIKEEVFNVINLIFLNNISLNDVFSKLILLNDAHEEILAIIREVIPSFEIEPNVMELSSDCVLLRNLHKGSTNLQPQLEGIGVEEMECLVEKQLEIEKSFYIGVKAVSRGRLGEASTYQKKILDDLKKEWRKSLTEAVDKLRKNEKLKFSKSQKGACLYIYLSSVPTENLVDILMETTLNLVEFSGGYGPSALQYRKMLGFKVFQCYNLRKKLEYGVTDKMHQLFKKYVAWYCNPSGPARNSRQKWQMVIQDSEKSNLLDLQTVLWPNIVRGELGSVLLDIILKEVKFYTKTRTGKVSSPVLYTILRHRCSAVREEIKCHPTVAEIFESVGFDILHFRSEEVPMVCPPRPWRTPSDGGYLFLHTDFIRKKDGIEGKVLRQEDIPVQQLYAVFDSLNALQSVPWMINEDVLDVVLEVFRTGGSEKLGVPLYPKRPPPGERWISLAFEERLKKNKEKKELIKQLRNNYGVWCEALYRLSLANHFRNQVFWLPQNCDFRGRVYPVPPLVNHLGSDLFRSLLVFAKGKPLGPKGLDWLKIHLINLTGTHKKKSVEERLAYANEILPTILDSAEKPLTGDKWWVESEEPWQTLATCMELKKALSVPDPETYMCSFPIHQDGSCNGLQHYAALGKDLMGAQSVNLSPSDKPQDIYNVVAQLIEQERCRDASDGIRIAQILDGVIERKVVKQTIMTTVYGVTPFGAKLQISKRLEEIPNFPKEYIDLAAAYLTQKTFLSLKKMFTSAKQIQDWFVNCATEICQAGEYVQWVSPLGLPVLQSYAKRKFFKGSKVIAPDIIKQRNAFPPNFIHSLDSCHMMLTSLYCEQAGLTFAAIHDCFWTHPNTVEVMNTICREQFVSLHSQTVLEYLSQFFKNNYTNGEMSDKALKVFEAVPEKGDFDIREVLNSVYFFS